MRMPGGVYLLALAVAAPAAHADPVYVIEQLVVNVMSDPAGGGERVATVKSGDPLELLDRQGEQSRVKLPNGTEGWIKSSYLSADPPLTVRLNERTAEVARLKQNVAKLEADLAAARSEAARAQPPTPHDKRRGDRASEAPSSTPANTMDSRATSAQPPSSQPASSEGAPVEHDPSPLFAPAPTAVHPAWKWVLATSAITLPTGFALGWQVLARRIRRKFGGLRIY